MKAASRVMRETLSHSVVCIKTPADLQAAAFFFTQAGKKCVEANVHIYTAVNTPTEQTVILSMKANMLY